MFHIFNLTLLNQLIEETLKQCYWSWTLWWNNYSIGNRTAFIIDVCNAIVNCHSQVLNRRSKKFHKWDFFYSVTEHWLMNLCTTQSSCILFGFWNRMTFESVKHFWKTLRKHCFFSAVEQSPVWQEETDVTWHWFLFKLTTHLARFSAGFSIWLRLLPMQDFITLLKHVTKLLMFWKDI